MLEALGATLRAAREARGWTLEEVERATRIRLKYLAALEAGEFDLLPTALQARGFLRNYAQHLGLDPAQALGQLDEALKPARRGVLPLLRPQAGARVTPAARRGAADAADQAERPAPRSPFASLRRARRLFTPDILIALFVLAVIVAFFVWGGSRLASTVFNQSPITQTPELIGPTSTPTPTIIANITATFTPPPPVISFSNVQLTLVIEQRTFVRVSADGTPAYEGLLFPGDRKDFVGQSLVEVTTGSGASVRVILNQRDLGPMGEVDEVVTRQYLPSGMITVTPTITRTPSATPTPSQTSTPTLSPTATRTPTITRTPRP